MKSSLRKVLQNQVPVPLVSSNNGSIFSLTDRTTSLSGNQSLLNSYGVMSTVYSCVSLLSESTARTEWKLFQKQPTDARRRWSTTDNPSDNRQEVIKHPALSLISNPNDFYSRFRLFEIDQTYLELIGEYYWVLDRGNALGLPTAIWPVPPQRIQPVPSPTEFIAGYVYSPPDGSMPIPLTTDEVISCLLPNPLDPLHGLGPVQSILVDIDASRYSAEWNRNFFINNATPYGVITTPTNLDDVEFKQLMDRWRESHRGVSRSGRVGVLEGGNVFTPVGMTAKDMDWINGRNLSRDIVREAYRMHKIMLGTTDDVNRANAQTGEEVFASWCVVPRLERKRDMLNNQLLPMFYGGKTPDVEFDFITPVPPNREQDMNELKVKAAAAQQLIESGYDPNDVAEVLGLPAMNVVEKATQIPAAPPGWIPAPAPDGSNPAEPDDLSAAATEMENRLRKTLSNGHENVDLDLMRQFVGGL